MADSVSTVIERLIGVLEPSGETYAFGGAIALAAWSAPRATADVDIVLWIDLENVDRAVSLIERAGISVVREVARTEARTQGMFIGRAGPIRVARGVRGPQAKRCSAAAAARKPATVSAMISATGRTASMRPTTWPPRAIAASMSPPK